MSLLSKLTYSRRLFLWLLGYSLLLVGCFMWFQYHREKEFKIAELNAQLQLINRHIIDDMSDSMDIAQVFRSQPHSFKELRVSVIDKAGRVVYDNSLDSIPDANHLSRQEIDRALASGAGYTVRRHSESTGNTYFYSATLGKNGYIVRTAVPYSVSLSRLLKADYGFLWVMCGVTVVMCVLGFFVTRRLGMHIIRLNDFAERAERGERIYDTAPFPKDELGAISSHIVRLYADLQKAIAERDKEHYAALDAQCEKERIKKQLTNNINHELKTPVASIQVCVETLMSHKNMSEEKRTEFLGRCLDNTHRLKMLLEDVALITRMDDAPSSISREPVDISDVVSDIVDECEPLAASKAMEIRNTVSSMFVISGNRALLASVFRNLIGNAIAHSGASLVSVDPIAVSDEKMIISVSDNGSGIPSEHIPRIFERFYRIDKGRSRLAGGTGLGLSIVKNAMIWHGGTISVRNLPQGGLSFTLTFVK